MNFNTNLSTIFYYPRGAGGKFVINCLGLGDNAVFQHDEQAQKQINNELDDLGELLWRLNRTITKESWSDLGLGCFKLLRHQAFVDREKLETVEILNTIIEGGYRFFLVAHTADALVRLLELWPNAVVVEVVNYDLFQRTFGRLVFGSNEALPRDVRKYWQNIRADSWPEDPPANYNDISKLPYDIYNELYESFNGEIDKFYPDSNNPKARIDYHWDSENIFDENKFLIEIRKLYDALNVTGFDEEKLKIFRDRYMYTLEVIKNGTN